MNCDLARPLLSDYIDGALDLPRRTALERHLATCERCAAELKALGESLAALRSQPPPADSPDLNRRVLDRLADLRQQLRRETARPGPSPGAWLRYAGASAAAAAVALLAVLGGGHWYAGHIMNSVGTQQTYIFGQRSFLPDAPASLRVALVDHETGAPIAGGDVRLALYRPKEGLWIRLYRGRTDRRGTVDADFRIPDIPPGAYRLAVVANSRQGRDRVEEPVTLIRRAKLMLTTDRPVYQPGHTIHIRTLALNQPNQEPAAGREVVIEVADPKGTLVFKQSLKTTKWGIAFAGFELADEVNLGDYQIKATLAGITEEKTVSVKRYVLPKFKVAFEADRKYYRPGESMHGAVSADYFFGKPVERGQVKVELYSFDYEFDKFATIEGRTNADGQFEFDHRLPRYFVGQPLAQGNALVRADVSVIDSAEHEERITRTFPVSSQEIDVTLIPEAGYLRPNIENIVYVVTSYPSGEPADVAAEVKTGGAVQTISTGPLGVGELRLDPGDRSDPIKITLTARDRRGAEAKVKQSLRVVGGNTITLRLDKGIYRVGDTARVVALAPARTPTVYLDAVRGGQTIFTRAAEVKDGRAQFVFDIGPDYTGTVTFTAYAIPADGNTISDNRAAFIEPGEGLRVQVEADRGTYQPGEEATLDFHVTDPDGRGTAAALGVSIVDESVFALEEATPGLARLFFALEEDILEPRHQIKYGPDLPGSLDLESLIEPEEARPGDAMIQRAAKAILAGARGSDAYRWAAATYDVRRARHVEREWTVRDRLAAIQDYAFWVLLLSAVFIFGLASASRLARTGRERLRGILIAGIGVTGVLFLVGWWPFALPATAVILCGLWATRGGERTGRGYLASAFKAFGVIAGLGFFAAVILLPVFCTAGRHAMMRAPLAGSVRDQGGARNQAPAPEEPIESRGWSFDGSEQEVPPAPALAPARGEPSYVYGWFDKGGTPRLAATTHATRHAGAPGPTAEPPRLRQFFPETLYVNPQLITDDEGRASISLAMADSITTWRLTALANSLGGGLGSVDRPVRVFQDFFVDLDLPVALTQGDEISIPVAVYNYLPGGQDITITLDREDWFTLRGEAARELGLSGNAVTVVHFPIVVNRVGRHQLTIHAQGSKMSDAIRKPVSVEPNGKLVERVTNGRIAGSLTAPVTIPAEALPDSAKLLVKIYPGVFSQIVEGLEGMLHAPYGCFEQTSSINYPNLLALDYLKRTQQIKPDIQMKAEKFLNLGYQRLLTFEVSGGGFDWYGQSPAKLVLTAYGLLELTDMARVFPVDEKLIGRTEHWLLSQQRGDGSWGSTGRGWTTETWYGVQGPLATTAYVVWSLAEAGHQGDTVNRGVGYLARHADDATSNYTRALLANALVAADPDSAEAERAVDRLALAGEIKQGRMAWRSDATMMYGTGRGAEIETTALAAYALLKSGRQRQAAQRALEYLIDARDGAGTWGSTQATILALKALVVAAEGGLGGGTGSVEVRLSGERVKTVRLEGDAAEVMHLVDLGQVSAGKQTVELRAKGDTQPIYQIVSRYYLPWSKVAEPKGSLLDIDLNYDRTKLRQNDTVAVRATVNYRGSRPAKMVIVDLGIPPGFRPLEEDFDALVKRGTISRYETTGRQIIIYLRSLAARRSLVIRYHLKAKFPVKALTPPSQVYEYYNPDPTRAVERPIGIRVT